MADDGGTDVESPPSSAQHAAPGLLARLEVARPGPR